MDTDRARMDGPGDLSSVEQLLVQARMQADCLAVALVRAPFNEDTVAALRQYLDHKAGPAAEAYRMLCAQPPETLRTRIEELTRPRSGRTVPGRPQGQSS